MKLLKQGHLLAQSIRPRHSRQNTLVCTLFHYGTPFDYTEALRALHYRYGPDTHIELRLLRLRYPWLHGDHLASLLYLNASTHNNIPALVQPLLEAAQPEGLAVQVGGRLLNARTIPRKTRSAFSQGKVSRALITGRADGVNLRGANTVRVMFRPVSALGLAPDNNSILSRITV